MKKGRNINKITDHRRLSKYSSIVILLVVFFIIECFYPLNSCALIGIKEGDAPKKVSLQDLNGKTVNVAELFGNKPVILVFWKLTKNKVFLDYSLDVLLFLKDFYEKYHDKPGMEIFAVYTPENDKEIPESEISAVQNLVITNKIKFPVLIDKGFKFFKEFGIIALPSTIMVNKAGKIQFIYPSFSISARPVISKQIRNLIGIDTAVQKKESKEEKKPDARSDMFYNYALNMYKKGLLEQALSPLEKSLKLNPDYSWSHNLIGIILWKKGNFDRSMEEFRKAITLDKNNIAAHLNYAALLFEQGKLDEAEKILLSSTSKQAKFKVRAHYLLGLVYKNTNRIDQAVGELELANSILEVWAYEKEDFHFFTFSFRIPMLRALSELYSSKGNNEKALELLHKAIGYALGFEGKPVTGPLNKRNDIMVYE